LRQPLPVPIASITQIPASNELWRFYEGHLVEDGQHEFCVVLDCDRNEADMVETMGFFGRRRSVPKKASVALEDVIPEPVLEGSKRVSAASKGQQLESEEEEEDDEEPTKAKKLKLDTRSQRGDLPLVLDACEAFFLSHALGCLLVKDQNGQELDLKSLWKRLFTAKTASHYVIYKHFRSKGWVVRDGAQFGSDFLLYKEGPPFFHASFSVLVDPRVHEDQGLSFRDLHCFNRVSESAAKQLLLASVAWPNGRDWQDLKAVEEASVSEVLFKRWIPNKEREKKGK